MDIHARRSWMYNRLLPDKKGYTQEFLAGIDEFLDFATARPQYMSGEKVRCPCSKHQNRRFEFPDDVKCHLLKYGFRPDYWYWIGQGEMPPNLPTMPIELQKRTKKKQKITKQNRASECRGDNFPPDKGEPRSSNVQLQNMKNLEEKKSHLISAKLPGTPIEPIRLSNKGDPNKGGPSASSQSWATSTWKNPTEAALKKQIKEMKKEQRAQAELNKKIMEKLEKVEQILMRLSQFQAWPQNNQVTYYMHQPGFMSPFGFMPPPSFAPPPDHQLQNIQTTFDLNSQSAKNRS